ncbi:MAG: kynureninase [Isosphaeraceae bacterium]|jgi:kynureninase|nr:MAG: kynureninase [Isosphaeraceae bacterium]
MTDDPLLIHRPHFAILEQTNYLISNSLGAVPREAALALAEFYEIWASRGVRAWEEGWWELVETTGDLVAPLIAAGPGQVVFQPCVTIAHAVVLSVFEPSAGRSRLVIDEGHFPSILYLVGEQARRGFEVVVIPGRSDGSFDLDRFLAAIDGRTAAALACHVQFRSSEIVDVAAIARQARACGAYSIIDGYQAVGSIPVDVGRLGIDVYIGGCLKWLCGGPGNAFVWVAPERLMELRPALTGWMAHRRPFAFERTLDRRDGAGRLLHGTPNIAALYAARPALERIAGIGLDAIRAKSLRQTGHLLALADARGWPTPTPRDPDRRGGTVALGVPNGLPVSRALKARDILCDYRPGVGIRLSPHFYNRDDELDAAIGAIDEILSTQSWRDHIARDSPVT